MNVSVSKQIIIFKQIYGLLLRLTLFMETSICGRLSLVLRIYLIIKRQVLHIYTLPVFWDEHKTIVRGCLFHHLSSSSK